MRSVFSISGATAVLVATLCCTATLRASTKESRTAGEATYHSAGCEQCHGADWSGTDRGPDLRGVGKRMKREEIDKQIRAGGGGMPAFGDVLTDAQVVQLVDFLESQKKAPKAVKTSKAAPLPPSEKPKSSEPE